MPKTKTEPGFRVIAGKGFQITFENGHTLSVMFGAGNYCFNRGERMPLPGDEPRDHRSPNAEIAVWDRDGEWVRLEGVHEGDDVVGWVGPDAVAAIADRVARLPGKDD
jgi:hypothetical protein